MCVHVGKGGCLMCVCTCVRVGKGGCLMCIFYFVQVIKNTLNPVWRPFEMSTQKLCSNDPVRVIKVREREN